MFIKESDAYIDIKKNVSKKIPLKIAVLLTTSFVSFASSYSMVLVQKMIDIVSEKGLADLTEFYSTLILTIAFIISYVIMTYVGNILSFFLGIAFQKNTLLYLFKSFYKQDFLFAKKYESGDVASRLLNDSGDVSDWLATGALTFIELTVSFLIKFVILWNYLPPLALTLILTMSVCFAVTRKINVIIAEYNKKSHVAISNLMQFFMQANKSFVDVKQLKQENLYISKMVDILEKSYFNALKKALYWGILYKFIFTIVLYIFPVAVLLIGIFMTLKGHFTIGKTIAVYTLVNMTQSPLSGIANNFSTFKSTMILSERLDCLTQKVDTSTQVNELKEFNNLEFDCEKFSYDENEKVVLKNLKFTLNKGDLLCIKGRTGVGKSTIASLLMRFMTIKDGSIKINGEKIETYTSESFYKHFNMVNQSPYIFEDNIINNIALGEEYSEEEIKEVIEVAQLKDFMEEYGSNHELNEDANNISGGQRQRIGLARILIRKPQFLLLDEPTSALDEATALNLVNSLKEFAKKHGITIAVITHSSIFEEHATQLLDLNQMA